MKRVISIFLIIFLFCFQIDLKVFAEFCKEPSIKIKEINFDVVLNDDGNEDTWTGQEFPDKYVELVRYEEIPKLKTKLEKRGKHALEDLIKAWNSQASSRLIDLAGKAIMDLFVNREISEETKKELLEDLKNKLVDDRLSDEEKIMAITAGKTMGNLATAAIGTVSASASVGVGIGVKTLTTGITSAAGGTLSTVGAAANPILLGAVATGVTFYGLGKLLTSAYNEYFTSRREREARNDMDKSKNLFDSVGDSILRHDWINKNLLIMSTTKQPECGNVDTRFYNHTGISYEKSQQEINEDFAAAECAFLGYVNNEECEKQSLNAINCIFDRKAGRHNSRCPKNCYFNNTPL